MRANSQAEYLFVDGGSFRSSVQKISQQVFGSEGAFQPSVEGLAGTGQYQKIFYYDAISGRRHNESHAEHEARVEPERIRFAEIQALDRVHVSLGKIVGDGASRRQKGVDVKLAVDMMTHAFRGNIARATLFAGDADFKPVLEALVAEGIHVTLWHPLQAPADLKGAADSTRLFNFRDHFVCFSQNGRDPAFIHEGMGSVSSPQIDNPMQTEINGYTYTAKFENLLLTVYRMESTFDYTFIQLRSSGSSLEKTLLAFQEMHGWPVANTDESWVKVTN